MPAPLLDFLRGRGAGRELARAGVEKEGRPGESDRRCVWLPRRSRFPVGLGLWALEALILPLREEEEEEDVEREPEEERISMTPTLSSSSSQEDSSISSSDERADEEDDPIAHSSSEMVCVGEDGGEGGEGDDEGDGEGEDPPQSCSYLVERKEKKMRTKDAMRGIKTYPSSSPIPHLMPLAAVLPFHPFATLSFLSLLSSLSLLPLVLSILTFGFSIAIHCSTNVLNVICLFFGWAPLFSDGCEPLEVGVACEFGVDASLECEFDEDVRATPGGGETVAGVGVVPSSWDGGDRYAFGCEESECAEK